MRRGQNSSRCLFFKCHYNLLLLGTKWVGIHIKHLCQATLLTKLLNIGFLLSFKLRKVSKDLAYFVSFHLRKDLDFFQGGYQLNATHCNSKGRGYSCSLSPKASDTGVCRVQPSVTPDLSHLKSVSVPREEIPPPHEVYRKLPLQVFALLSFSLVPLSKHCSRSHFHMALARSSAAPCSILAVPGIVFFINKIFM